MRKFNKLYVANQTRVKLFGWDDYALVREIHPTRQWIKVVGLEGSFQWGDVEKFTNRVAK